MYKIGIGALIEGEAHNTIRALELKLADKTSNFSGLGQPPHITVKAPFDVISLADIKTYQALLEGIAQNHTSLDLELCGAGNFNQSVLYLQVAYSESLRQLHEDLLVATLRHFPEAKGKFEDKEAVFHATLAMGLRPTQFAIARETLETLPQASSSISANIRKLGLFLKVSDSNQWIVLAEKMLIQKIQHQL